MKHEALYTACLLFLMLTGVGAAASTQQSAEQAVENARSALQAMEAENYSATAVQDTLSQAETALQDGNYGEAEQFAAQAVERKNRAFHIADRLHATRLETRQAQENGVNTTGVPRLLDNAADAFQREQYDTAEARLDEANTVLAERRAEQSRAAVIAEAGRSFVERNQVALLLFAAFLLTGLAADYFVLRERRKKKQVRELRAEQAALHYLMRETQKTFFVDGDVPGHVYELRRDVYRDRLNQVEEQLATVDVEPVEDETGSSPSGSVSGKKEAFNQLERTVELLAKLQHSTDVDTGQYEEELGRLTDVFHETGTDYTRLKHEIEQFNHALEDQLGQARE